MLEIRQRDLVPLVWRDAKLKSVVTCELLTSSSQHRVEYQGLGKQTCRLLESRLYPPSSPSRSLFFSSLSPNLFLSLSPLSQSLSLSLSISLLYQCLSVFPSLPLSLSLSYKLLLSPFHSSLSISHTFTITILYTHIISLTHYLIRSLTNAHSLLPPIAG